MKKLISLLGSLTFLTTSVGSVVACNSNSYDKKTSEGDSILISNLGLDFGNGKSTISTSDVLMDIIENGSANSTIRGELIKQFINLFSAGFLAKAKTEIKNTDISTNPYLSSGLESRLSDAFAQLQSSKKAAVQDEYGTYKTNYGKKALTKWIEMLKGLFPGVTDQKTLEQKYVSYKMLNDSDSNVNSTLLDILLNTNAQGIQFTDKNTLINYWSQYNSATNKDEWVKNNESKASGIVWGTMDGNYTSFADDKSLKESLDKVTSPSQIKYSSPVADINNGLNLPTNFYTGNYVSGFISNSQRFFLDKYYQTEAPVAITGATVSYATNGKMDDGITWQDFMPNDPTSSDNQKATDVEDFLKSLSNQPSSKSISAVASSVQTNAKWNTLYAGGSLENFTKKSYSKLLTMSDSTDFTQMTRNCVYSYINNYAKGNTSNFYSLYRDYKQSTDTPSSFQTLVNKLTRTKNATWGGSSEDMYVEVAPGMIAYIDSGGLEFVRIEGFDKLIDSKRYPNSGIMGISQNKIDTNTLNEIHYFNEFNNMNDKEKLINLQNNAYTGINTDVPSDTSMYGKLNSNIKDSYLHFLVNMSLLNGISGAYNSFDIISEVKSYIKISQPSSSSGSQYTYWTALIDYFENIDSAGEKIETDSFDSFFKMYFNVQGTGPHEADANKIVSFVESQIQNVSVNIANDSVESYLTAWRKENKTIENETTIGYPKGEFVLPAGPENEMSKFMLKWWTPYKSDSGFYKLSTIYYLNLIKSYKGEN